MAWKWFGAKTLILLEAIGKPKLIDDNFDDDDVLLEERVVLIKARSYDEAINKGEKEAIRYVAECEYKNSYGQIVKRRYLKTCEVFELFDEPNESGVEVFSSTQLVSRKIKDSILIENKFGIEESSKSFDRRKKFRNAELIAEIDK